MISLGTTVAQEESHSSGGLDIRKSQSAKGSQHTRVFLLRHVAREPCGRFRSSPHPPINLLVTICADDVLAQIDVSVRRSIRFADCNNGRDFEASEMAEQCAAQAEILCFLIRLESSALRGRNPAQMQASGPDCDNLYSYPSSD